MSEGMQFTSAHISSLAERAAQLEQIGEETQDPHALVRAARLYTLAVRDGSRDLALRRLTVLAHFATIAQSWHGGGSGRHRRRPASEEPGCRPRHPLSRR